MVSSSDYNNLLLTVLRGMAREADRLDALTRSEAEYEAPAEVKVDKTRFEERAQVYRYLHTTSNHDLTAHVVFPHGFSCFVLFLPSLSKKAALHTA